MLERIEASQRPTTPRASSWSAFALGSIVLALGLGYVFSWSIVGAAHPDRRAAAPDRGRRVRRARRRRQPRRAGRARRRRQPHQRGAGQPLSADRGAGAGAERGARAADRDQRGAGRHQPLDLRAAAGAGHDRRHRRPPLPGGMGEHVQARARRHVPLGRRYRDRRGVPALPVAKSHRSRAGNDRRPDRARRQDRARSRPARGPRIHLVRGASQGRRANRARRAAAARECGDRRDHLWRGTSSGRSRRSRSSWSPPSPIRP